MKTASGGGGGSGGVSAMLSLLGGEAVQERVLRVGILVGLMVLAFACRLFAVIRFESTVHEFDPQFNHRSSRYLIENGVYAFLNWFDAYAWYPLGRIVGPTVYPGLMWTAALAHRLLHAVNVTIAVRNVCVFLAPCFASLTVLVVYAFAREVRGTRAALVSAALIAIVPGYISRSVAGSFDNEAVAIFALISVYALWVRAVKTGSIAAAALCALAYFYMVAAWGGYVFIINLIPLHVLALLVTGRFSQRLYVAYCTFYVLGTLLAMQIPFVGFQAVQSSEHMAAMGTFGLLQLVVGVRYVRTLLAPATFARFVYLSALAVGSALAVALAVASATGYVSPWTGRFYSLLDPTYAKANIPIIASVSEHQPTTWASFFFDLHIVTLFAPLGLYFCFAAPTDANAFIVIYGVTSVYFAGVMVRLMLVLAPALCVLAGIGIAGVLDAYVAVLKPRPPQPAALDTVVATDEHAGDVAAALAAGADADAAGADAAASASASAGGGASRVSAARAAASSASASASASGVGGGGGGGGGGDDDGVIIAGASVGTAGNERPAYALQRGVASAVVAGVLLMLLSYQQHCTWVTAEAYSSPSIVLAAKQADGSRKIFDDFREGYRWIAMNTPDDARIMSWWDYGYQLQALSNRTVLVDNNTWNNTHIAQVGRAFAVGEDEAYETLLRLDVDYVLVWFGGLTGYASDDVNKFLWMVRIAGSVDPLIKEEDYMNARGEFTVGANGARKWLDSLMYKLCYHRYGDVYTDPNRPPGFDRARSLVIGNKDFRLRHLEEAYSSEHWLMRIYRVLKPAPRS